MEQSQGQAPSTPSAPPTGIIGMTDKAAAQVRMIQEREGKPNSVLRVSVVGGGCSGLSYKLSFDDKIGEKDKVFDLNGVKLATDTKSLLFIKGTVLDFTDGLEGQGFVFINPNAKQSCGCGSSFSA